MSRVTGPSEWQLGATIPMSSVWTERTPRSCMEHLDCGGPERPGLLWRPFNGRRGSRSRRDLASTSDPTTNNLVTFNASTSDASAYNNYLMEESYLVVPLTGFRPTRPPPSPSSCASCSDPGSTGHRDVRGGPRHPGDAGRRPQGCGGVECRAAAAANPNASAAPPPRPRPPPGLAPVYVW